MVNKENILTLYIHPETLVVSGVGIEERDAYTP